MKYAHKLHNLQNVS